jgi:hypothetical protein
LRFSEIHQDRILSTAKMTFENVLHDLINTIKDEPPAPEIVVSRLKQLEGLAEQATASQALSALWDQAVCELLRYGGRIYGTRRAAGANFWAQLTTVNKLLPIEGYGASTPQ